MSSACGNSTWTDLERQGAMRHERKFVGDGRLSGFALDWLRHICLADSNYPSEDIHSIYYDTPSFNSYAEKADGDYLKTKVRLRWYQPSSVNDAGKIPAFLEVKSKHGSTGFKARRELSLSRTWLDETDLADDKLRRLPYEQGDELNAAMGRGLFPMICIVYRRERFVCPWSGSRICLDTDIRAERANRNFLPGLAPGILNDAVVEVKGAGDAEIPWLRHLYSAGFRLRGFSKYAHCLSSVRHEVCVR